MRVRVNFHLLNSMYDKIQEIAREEDTSAADVFRRAVKEFIYNYKNKAINEFYEKEREGDRDGSTV